MNPQRVCITIIKSLVFAAALNNVAPQKSSYTFIVIPLGRSHHYENKEPTWVLHLN